MLIWGVFRIEKLKRPRDWKNKNRALREKDFFTARTPCSTRAGGERGMGNKVTYKAFDDEHGAWVQGNIPFSAWEGAGHAPREGNRRTRKRERRKKSSTGL